MILLATHGVARADSERPIPAPRDLDYPGVVRLKVDASDVDRRLVRVEETLPVATAGPLTLLYPRWLPGNNSTTGPIELLAGLQITTDRGERLAWRRDAEKMFAFHLDVPAGTTSLRLLFDFVTPTSPDQGRQVLTQDVLGVQWEKALLYPAGYAARRIRFEPSLALPTGWAYATALDGGARQGDHGVTFETTSLERLVDSPVFAGRHHQTFVLDPDPVAPVRLQVFADRAAELESRPEQIQAHRRLLVGEYMGQVLSPTVELAGDITQDHRDIVDTFEKGDLARLLAVMAEHNEHAKATMRAGIERAGAAGKG